MGLNPQKSRLQSAEIPGKFLSLKRIYNFRTRMTHLQEGDKAPDFRSRRKTVSR